MSFVDTRKDARPLTRTLCLLISSGACLVSGCGAKAGYVFKSSDTTSYAAPQLDPVLSESDQAEGTRLVRAYVVSVNQKDYVSAERAFSPALRSQCPPSTLAHQVTSEGFWTKLPGSHNWEFDQLQSLRHGNEMVVHTHFVAADTNLYKMNFSLRKNGGGWQIDKVLYPVQKNKAPLVLTKLGGPPAPPGHK